MTKLRTRESRRRIAAGWRSTEALEVRALLAAGDVDLSFGIAGKVRTEFRDSLVSSYTAFAMALQTDGRVVAAGQSGLARYLADGSHDASFGVGGQVDYPFYARNLAIQSDGKILIVGGTAEYNSSEIIVSRYLANGVLDTTFDGDGHARVSFGGTYAAGWDIVVQANSRIIAVGSSDTSIAIARLTSTGALDTTFDGDGRQLRLIENHVSGTAYSVDVQSDGKIVLAGTTAWPRSFANTVDTFFVMRLNPGGGLDRTFDLDGYALTSFFGGQYSRSAARSLAIQADGEIVVTGHAYGNFTTWLAVARYNSDGSLDTGFSTDGWLLLGAPSYPSDVISGVSTVVLADGSVLTPSGSWVRRFLPDGMESGSFNSSGVARSVVVQPDDRVVVGGSFNGLFGVGRFLVDRSLDASFSADGIVRSEFGPGIDKANGATLDANGKTVVVGTALRGFGIARYNVNGSLDRSFSQDGKLTIDFGTDTLEAGANDVVVQPDGKLVVAGLVRRVMNQYGLSEIAVVRLNANGTLDSSFGTGGKVRIDLDGYATANVVALQSDGRIVLGGYGRGGYFTVVRLLANGTLDRSFSGDGSVTLQAQNGAGSAVSDLAILPDGRILATGEYMPYSTGLYDTALMMARFNPNGSFDTTFGTTGRIIEGTSVQRTANRVALLPDGKFLVGGNATLRRQNSTSSRMAVTRYNSDGTHDSTFGTVTDTVQYSYSSDPFTGFAVSSSLRSMIVQPNGRIVLAGGAVGQMAVLRLNADGTRDSSFAGDGELLTSFSNVGGYEPADVLRQVDGRLVVVGSHRVTYPVPGDSDFVLTRLLDATEAPASMTVSLNAGGSIELRDLWNRNDRLSFQYSNGAIDVIDPTSDSRAVFQVLGLPTITGGGTKHIRIPLELLTAIGKPIVVNGFGGDDSVTVMIDDDDAGRVGIRFLGGTGTDLLNMSSSPRNAVWRLNAPGTGEMIPTGQAKRTFADVEQLLAGVGNDQLHMTAATTTAVALFNGGQGVNSLRMTVAANVTINDDQMVVSGAINQTIKLVGLSEATITGHAGPNVFDGRGFSGHLSLYGLQGNDELYGGFGNDLLIGAEGHDQLFGLDGNDILNGGLGNDLLDGDAGDDSLYGEDGMDILVGSWGTDVLNAGSGQDLLMSGSSNLLSAYARREDRLAIMAAWMSAEAYSAKINRLQVTGVQGFNSVIRLTPGSTVLDDFEVDTLFRESGLDWFFAANSGPLNELGLAVGGLRDLQLGEVLTGLPPL